jgi:hypothetical protein
VTVFVLMPVLILRTGLPGEFFQAVHGVVDRIRPEQ